MVLTSHLLNTQVTQPDLGALGSLTLVEDLAKVCSEPALALGGPAPNVQATSIPSVDLWPPRTILGLVALPCSRC